MNKRLVYTLVAAVAVVGATAGALNVLISSKGEVAEEPVKPATELFFSDEPEKLDTSVVDGSFSLLVIGSDSREGQRIQDGVEGELNDVTMLIKVDETHQRADIISFPRDAVVPMGVCTGGDPSSDYRQINTGLSLGGADCVKKSVENLIGEPVNATALVSFNAVEDLTEAVGGVKVCIAEPIYSYHTGDLMFDAGEHNLSGAQALSFVRERYGFGDGGDLGRVYNQQVFLQSFLKEFRAGDTMANPQTFWRLAAATSDNLELSENITDPYSLLMMVNTFLAVPEENYQFFTAPVSTSPEDPNRLVIDNTLLNELIAYTNSPPMTVEVEPTVTEEGTAPAEVETQVILPTKPESVPASDLYAPKTGETPTVTLCN